MPRNACRDTGRRVLAAFIGLAGEVTIPADALSHPEPSNYILACETVRASQLKPRTRSVAQSRAERKFKETTDSQHDIGPDEAKIKSMRTKCQIFSQWDRRAPAFSTWPPPILLHYSDTIVKLLHESAPWDRARAADPIQAAFLSRPAAPVHWPPPPAHSAGCEFKRALARYRPYFATPQAACF